MNEKISHHLNIITEEIVIHVLPNIYYVNSHYIHLWTHIYTYICMQTYILFI